MDVPEITRNDTQLDLLFTNNDLGDNDNSDLGDNDSLGYSDHKIVKAKIFRR